MADLENTLYLELKDGRVVIELLPDLAPRHVERVKTLARQGFYDGTVFHPRIASIAAGYRSPDEVRIALKACAASIPSAFWNELKAAGLIDPAVPTG